MCELWGVGSWCVTGARRRCENSLFHCSLVRGGQLGRGWGLKEGGEGSFWNTLEFLGDVRIAGPPPLEKGYVSIWEKGFVCGEGRVWVKETSGLTQRQGNG